MSASTATPPEEIIRRFLDEGYVCPPDAATVLHLAEHLGKPILVEGPPGVGKTELAKLWAKLHDAELIRLQCYEGLDETRALYEWSYGKQMLYAQLLREKTSDVVGDAHDLNEAVASLSRQTDAFFSEAFLVDRPLLAALRRRDPTVLLIDEIDRADEEFEAFLLEILSDFQVTVPELGTIRAAVRPWVILTSNDARELSDALRRRCLYLYIDYPTADHEREILRQRVPGLSEGFSDEIVRFVGNVRRAALRKQPGIAETVDWALALVALGATGLGDDVIRDSIGALVKNREDVDTVLERIGKLRR